MPFRFCLFLGFLVTFSLPSLAQTTYTSTDGAWSCEVTNDATILTPVFQSHQTRLTQSQAQAIADFLTQDVPTHTNEKNPMGNACFVVQGIAKVGDKLSTSSPLAKKRRELITQVLTEAQIRYITSDAKLSSRIEAAIQKTNGKAVLIKGQIKS